MLLDSVIGWVSFIISLSDRLGSPVVDNTVRVSLRTGREINGLTGTGGGVPSIYIYDTSQRLDGSLITTLGDSHKIDSDSSKTYDIKTKGGEVKDLHVRMHSMAGDQTDGICLTRFDWSLQPHMTNAQARSGSIMGDLFYHCGFSWYLSGKYYDKIEVKCGWLDGNDSNGNSAYGFYVDTTHLGNGFLPDLGKKFPTMNSLCGIATYFYKESRTAVTKRSVRSARSIKEKYGNKAFVTLGAGAIDLCDSPTSWGPSMLSLKEGVFCDMDTKTKVPICRDGKTKNCMKYNHEKSKGSTHPRRVLTAANVTGTPMSFDSFDLEYFTTSDGNGTIIDDGSNEVLLP
ncbi:hypothetical protein BGZ76_004757 [Entomortierella beljakovae]|nr:hypothetical protein BGZ76_004757 [Entomortierella beljakovae]